MLIQSWISPKTQKGLPSKIAGLGFFAKEFINKGEIVAVKAGHIIDTATLEANRQIIRDSEMQIADDLFIAPLSAKEFPCSMIYCNHSCNPNACFGGNIVIAALCNIEPGEEIVADYAMHMTIPGYELDCNCGCKHCRGKITGNDWQNPELQQKYAGHFAWYIQQKIKHP